MYHQTFVLRFFGLLGYSTYSVIWTLLRMKVGMARSSWDRCSTLKDRTLNLNIKKSITSLSDNIQNERKDENIESVCFSFGEFALHSPGKQPLPYNVPRV